MELEKSNIRKIVIEKNDGETMELKGNFAVFFEDYSSKLMREIFKGQVLKLVGIVHSTPEFVAAIANSMLKELANSNPGMDLAVMMKHIDDMENSSLMSVLEKILNEK